jgi:hypothetical protein
VVAEALGKRKDKASVDILNEMIKDPDREVRSEVRSSLTKHPHPDSVIGLVSLLDRDDFDNDFGMSWLMAVRSLVPKANVDDDRVRLGLLKILKFATTEGHPATRTDGPLREVLAGLEVYGPYQAMYELAWIVEAGKRKSKASVILEAVGLSHKVIFMDANRRQRQGDVELSGGGARREAICASAVNVARCGEALGQWVESMEHDGYGTGADILAWHMDHKGGREKLEALYNSLDAFYVTSGMPKPLVV